MIDFDYHRGTNEIDFSLHRVFLSVEKLACTNTQLILRGQCLFDVLNYGHSVETNIANESQQYHANALNYYGKTLSKLSTSHSLMLGMCD